MWVQPLVGFSLGLALFLVGLLVMSRNLVSSAGSRLQQVLAKAAGNQYLGCLLGTVVTAVVQSSSAVNATAVGLVGSGVLTYRQGLAIMLGANIGTTVTAQLTVLPLTEYGLWLTVVGLLWWLIGPRRGIHRYVGAAVAGLGGLFMGMQLMQTSLAPLGVTVAQRLFPAAQKTGPLNAIGIGVAVTLMLQSSSAVTGIVIAMVGSGILDPRLGIFITLGANIGTVGTSLLASVGMNSLAKKAALTDLLLNLVAVLCVLPWFDKFHHLVVLCSPRASAQIANAHTMFNIAASTLALPFVPVIAKLVDAE